MSYPVALFVGGPWDGRRRTMEQLPRYFDVALMEPLKAAAPGDSTMQRPGIRKYIYQRLALSVGNWNIYFPDAWTRGPDSPVELVLRRLAAGYVPAQPGEWQGALP